MDPDFGHLAMVEIDINRIKRYVTKRRQQVSDTTVKRELAFLSSLFSYSIDTMENAPEANPVLAFPKRHLKENKRDRYLTKEEFQKVRKNCLDQVHKMILDTAVETGMRHSELRNMTKDWINLEAREITIPAKFAKSNRSRIVPISENFLGTLADHLAHLESEYVFVSRVHRKPFTSFQKFFVNSVRRAGLEDVVFHDLRHTFASWWVQEGRDFYVLKNILGHSSTQMTERYGHLNTDALHRERNK